MQYGKHREEEAYNQVKKSCELVQQAQLEKQEVILLSLFQNNFICFRSMIVPLLYVLIMSCTRFRANPHSIVARMSKNSSLDAGAKSEV